MARRSTKLNIGNEKKIGYNRYRWLACSSCGKERWVMIIRNQPRNGTCVHCSDRSKQALAMRLANLGTPRTQETRDRISRARKHKIWEYAYVPPESPSIGDKAMINKKSCIWSACSLCGVGRWVRTRRGGFPKHDICIICTNQLLEKREVVHQQWTPENKDATVKRLMRAQNVKPNKPERLLLNLLNELYPNEWKYVGDGRLVIEGKNPDFVNCNGKKLLIECFGDYWHGEREECYERTEKGRVALFEKYGYKTLIVWERELKDEKELTKKIWEFVG